MRVVVALGARPNVVKIGPLIPEIGSAGITVQVAFTGSRDLARSAVAGGAVTFFGIELPEPTWFLDVGSGTEATCTGKAMLEFERLFSAERPDAVLVVGDVSATFAAAVSAAKAGIPVVHLDAGLRCGDLTVPEEINRVLISRVAAMHLTPTEEALEVLEDEGIEPERIHFVGSLLAESVLRHLDEVKKDAPEKDFGMRKGEYGLGSFHRPENLADPERLRGILAGMAQSSVPFLVPDANGLRRAILHAGLEIPERLRIIHGVEYCTMLALERDAAVVLTDSGGVQEEACVIGTPCVTVRPVTEYTATVSAGANELVAPSVSAILAALDRGLFSRRKWVVPKRWDKAVSGRVVRALKRGIIPLS